MNNTPQTVTDNFDRSAYKVLEILEQGAKKIYILGTAHVSKRSVEEVEQLIHSLKPDTVCVELCETRYQSMVDDTRWKKLNIFDVIKQGKTLLLMANLALASFQRKLGDQFGIKPGAELKAAVEAATETGAKLVLADRDVQITLKRSWANVPWWKRIVVMSGLIDSVWSDTELSEEDLESLKDKDQLSAMMTEFAEKLPEIKGPLIDERDQYLMSNIQEAEGNVVVAIVGAGHVQGMLSHFGTPVDRSLIEQIPPKKKWVGLLKWIIPALIFSAFYFGWRDHQGESFSNMLTAWVLPNSIMAGLLTIVAGGRFLSVVTAFVASPITSLNPTLGAGMVVGLVEAWLRKPTVEDLENLHDDIRTIKGFYRNPFTRVLLVTLFSTLGSALGAIVGLSWVMNIWAQGS